MNNDNPIAILDSMIQSLKTDDKFDNSQEMLSPGQVAEELNLHINTVYR